MKLPSFGALARSTGSRAKPYAVPLAVSGLLAYFAVTSVLEDAGRPAMPLDDSFIHFVYARRFAEGEPFTFSPGGGFSSGATSFVWPMVLAPFYALGLRGLDLVWAVWGIGTWLHAAVAVETRRLAEPLVGKGAAVGAAAMCLAFGAFAWFAWSGMETMALTWAMVRTARRVAEHAEASPRERTARAATGLALIGAACPLVRPEGGLMALVAAAALAAWRADVLTSKGSLARQLGGRAFAAVPLAGVALPPAVNLALTGHARSNTAIVKWAVGNPYYAGDRLVEFVFGNVRMLATDLLAGGPFTAIFLPEHAQWIFGAGLVALVANAARTRKVPRAVAVLALVLGTLIPCTFITILWNRVRYIWPFATGWFVIVACLGAEIQALCQRLRRDWDFVGALLTGLFAGALGSKLSWSIADLANSSRAIDAQQVKLGQWARTHLPEGAVIGVNDTGAIAYFSERRTFDVVGLTTEGEARYWVAGSGSRYEHYERLPREALPTHFIVYPQWMAIPPVLGERLFEATVTDQSILGGATKVAYVADWSSLGRASLPTSRQPAAPLVAELDVSDLESEAAHAYELGWASDGDNLVTTRWGEGGEALADGGRHRRVLDRFRVDLPEGRASTMIARLGAPDFVVLEVFVGGASVGTLDVPATEWAEVEIAIPADAGGRGRTVEVRARAWADTAAHLDPPIFTSMHYWFYEES